MTSPTTRERADGTRLFLATGTPLPELAGLTGLIAPTLYPEAIAYYGNPIMVAIAALVIGLAWTGHRISQREAALMLVLYAGYVLFMWQS